MAREFQGSERKKTSWVAGWWASGIVLLAGFWTCNYTIIAELRDLGRFFSTEQDSLFPRLVAPRSNA